MIADGVVQLLSGKLFSVLEPEKYVDVLELMDVAVSLARQPRYTGHTRINLPGCASCFNRGVQLFIDAPNKAAYRPCPYCYQPTHEGYSVAEHSVWVSRIVSPGHERAALCHDFAEAIISDVVSPIKYLPGLERLGELERGVEKAIARRFDVAYPWSPEVKAADYEMLCAEVRQLMPWRAAPHVWGEIPTREISPTAEHARLGLPYREALALFLNRAAELGVK